MQARYYNGKTISEWAEISGIKRTTLANRLKDGWSIEEATSTPYGTRREKELSLYKIAKQNHMSHKTLKKRIANGMTLENALSYDYKQNIVGKKFGRLLVLKEVSQKRDPSGKPRRNYMCLCDCGKCTKVLGENLVSGNTSSCGCLAIELTKTRNSKDITGKISGYLTAIKPVYSDKYGVHWLFKCKCGKATITTASNFLSGDTKSCGCYNLEMITLREKAEIAGQRFGNVTAIECVGQNQYKNYLWRCVCDCGNEFVVPASRLITGETRSCGCVHSRGEQNIAHYFKEKNIMFKRNIYFRDLKYKGFLFFDFIIWNHLHQPCLIEYQGIQHYVSFPNGFGDQQRLITDPMKREYCKKKSIPLYEIRYDEDLEKRLSEIVAYVNPVLSSEQEKV